MGQGKGKPVGGARPAVEPAELDPLCLWAAEEADDGTDLGTLC